MKGEIACDIDEYISFHPESVRVQLEKLRQTIRKAAPKAEEAISYQMPAFKFHGMLVYFAAYKKHIGFYPTGSGIAEFKKELSVYEGSKGTVRFPIDKPLPHELIGKIVKFRVKQNLEKKKTK
ncbi:MAG: iron chaperone [Cyclobacteriaceae bacterium]